MSGESVVGLTVGAVGLAFAMGEAAGTACAFVVGGAFRTLTDAMDASFAKRQAEEAARQDWTTLLVEVAGRNARIESLRAAVLARSLAVELPAALVLTRQTPEQARAWCLEVDTMLEHVGRVIVTDARSTLIQGLQGALAGGLVRSAGEVMIKKSASSDTTTAPAVATVLADLDRVVARLTPEVLEEDRRRIWAAAAHITARRGPRDAQARLQDLRYRVNEANAKARARRAEAVRAALLMQPLLVAATDTDASWRDHAGWNDLWSALQDVLAGRRRLETWMERAAVDFTAQIKAATERRYLREQLVLALEELGYTMDEPFQTHVPMNGVLSVTHKGWACHGVRLRLDEATSQLTTMLVRTAADQGWDASAQDGERELEWCGDLPKLAEILQRQGVQLNMVRATSPGARAVPLVASTAPERAVTHDPSVRRLAGGERR